MDNELSSHTTADAPQTASPPDLSPEEIRNGLLYPDWYWGAGQFTYSLPTADSSWPGYEAGSEPFTGYKPLTADQASRFRTAIELWDSYIAPDFVEVPDGPSPGNIRIAFSGGDGPGGSDLQAFWGYANVPSFRGGEPSPKNGDIWVNDDNVGSSFASGSGDWFSLLHEVGHALGLKHSFLEDGRPGLPPPFDNSRHTVMSYTHTTEFMVTFNLQQGGSVLYAQGAYTRISFPSSPLVLDIAAVQSRYGADPATRTGDDRYVVSQGDLSLQAIYDAGGNDTLDASGVARSSVVDLRPGAYSSIGYWSVDEQRQYWKDQLGSGYLNYVDDVIDGASAVYTWSNNFGIAFSTTIENAIGGSGADTLRGNGVANHLIGGEGSDLLLGEGGGDLLLGEAGLDTANGGFGADLINGGDGDDLIGGAEDSDLLGGASGNDQVFGDGGNDTVFGDGGRDTVNGGDGDDQVNGGDGDDLIGGGSGTDFLGGGLGPDVVYGDAGNDFILGDDGNDTVYGGSEGDLVFGGAGADTVLGDGGDDTLFGGQGADFVAGGEGADLINGGEEDDLIGGAAGADLLGGAAGNDTLHGDDGNDALYGDDGNDALFGGSGADTANGGVGADLINGGAADDLIGGAAGNDTLGGAGGADTIYGDAGVDVIYGDGGADTLSGGEGADRFVFTAVADSAPGASDRIVDFRADLGDRIDLSAIDAQAGTAANEAFSFVSAFSGRAGQAVLNYSAAANTTTLALDVTGDGQADAILLITGQVGQVGFVL